MLAALGVPALAPVVAALRTGEVEQRLRSAVEMLLGLARIGPSGGLVDRRGAATGHPLGRAGWPRSTRPTPAWWWRCCSTRSGCGPGEAVLMPAGNLHAYLRGAGVEIMAASDNVLRGGLTPKQVDVGRAAAGAALRGARPTRCARRSRSAPGWSAGRCRSPSSRWSRPPSPRAWRGDPARRRAADRAVRARQRARSARRRTVCGLSAARPCSWRPASRRLTSAATRSCSRPDPIAQELRALIAGRSPMWVADPTRRGTAPGNLD